MATSTKKTVKKTTKKDTKKITKKDTKKITKKDTKKKLVKGGKNESEEKHCRYFKIINLKSGETHGRFSGTKPKQAANKALTSLIKDRKAKGKDITEKIKFSIVECTRCSNHKQYNYIGSRKKLKEPMEVTIDGNTDEPKTIYYSYSNKVMKDKSIPSLQRVKKTKKTEKKTEKKKGEKKKTKKDTKKTIKKTVRKGTKKGTTKTKSKTTATKTKAKK